jgi:molybdopterin converting factor subunit 1
MKINILAFGIAREICGAKSFELELPEQSDTAALQSMLQAKFPRLAGLASCQLAVNAEYAQAPTLLADGDEVAIIPPVSGG